VSAATPFTLFLLNSAVSSEDTQKRKEAPRPQNKVISLDGRAKDVERPLLKNCFRKEPGRFVRLLDVYEGECGARSVSVVASLALQSLLALR
jgi:hypothetical protein